MESRLYKITNLPKWGDWCHRLNTDLRPEALETLREEGGTLEMFVNFCIGDQFYTLGIGDGYLPSHQEREINQQHQAMKKECLESLSDKPVIGYELTI